MSIVFITVILFSCKGKKDINTYTVKERGSALDSVVREMAGVNNLEGQYIGVGATPSKQWQRLKWIMTNASDSELIKLTRYKNPVVKCYAFIALRDRRNVDPFPILLEYLSDSTKLETTSGCIVMTETVGSFLLQNYTPRNAGQREIIDSVLLYSKNVDPFLKMYFWETIETTPERHARIKEIVSNTNDKHAIVALAKYKKQEDKYLITDLLGQDDNLSQQYALLAIAEFPDQSFFPALEKMLSDELRKTDNTYSGNSEALYKALAQYKSKKVRKLFDRVLRDMKGEQLVKHSDFIYQAVKENPDPIYDGLRYRHTYF